MWRKSLSEDSRYEEEELDKEGEQAGETFVKHRRKSKWAEMLIKGRSSSRRRRKVWSKYSFGCCNATMTSSSITRMEFEPDGQLGLELGDDSWAAYRRSNANVPAKRIWMLS